ncbi:hypothetical protein GOBAR_AA30503 [Gossypium barbadense]|uniref:Uncharacterized protein n=1 Tax=Gossypium barbadense TaxID=3634 RepID=A0A2P5WGG6_GOSBA|nr:hypothetical protein GOBAR_AA30503 [Gossypium barbadense]
MGRELMPWSGWGHKWPKEGLGPSSSSRVVDVAMEAVEVVIIHELLCIKSQCDFEISLEVEGRTEFECGLEDPRKMLLLYASSRSDGVIVGCGWGHLRVWVLRSCGAQGVEGLIFYVYSSYI